MERAIRIKHLYRIPVGNSDDATEQFMLLRGKGPCDTAAARVIPQQHLPEVRF